MQNNKQNQNKNRNALALYRRKRSLSQQRVSKLLGHKSHGALSEYESGRVLPTLTTALKLEIILRTPVAFLFPGYYEQLRHGIRADEDRLAVSGQQDLFDYSLRKL